MERVLKHSRVKSLLLVITLLIVTHSALATTAIIPADDDMVIGARAIVRGKVVAIESSFDENTSRIYTYITVKVREVLKGQIAERRIVLKELGGQVGDRISVVYGNPQFKKGEKVLLYLDTWSDGSLRTYQMFLGKFNIVTDPITGEEISLRSSPDENTTVLQNKLHGHGAPGRSTERLELSQYIRMVRTRLAANWERSVKFEAEAYGNRPMLAEPTEYASIAGNGAITPKFSFLGPFRFFEPDSGQPVSLRLNPDPSSEQGVPQVTINAADVAAAGGAWTNVSGCSLQVLYSGTLDQCYLSTGTPGIHVISNNCDGRNSPTSGCAGILAWGGVSQTGAQTRTINGTTFRQTTQGFVSMNPWAACSFTVNCNVQEILTHEIGHALGLGHSQFSDATMAAFAHFDGRCASIRTDDVNGIVAIYPGTGGGPGPLTINTTALAGGTVGTGYNQSLSASGGTPPYGWSLVQGLGTLPPGLSLSASGVITGSPTTAGTYNFTVRVTDSVPATAQKALGIVVSPPGGGGALNSQFVSQTVPTSVQPGQVFASTLRFMNTGTQEWSGSAFFFASQNPPLNQTWGGNGVSLAGFGAGPGQVLDVTFSATAPTTPGTYNFQWQMYENGGIGFFGQMSTNVAIQVGSAPPPTDGAAFVSQNVPSAMTVGQTYSVSVTMSNTGNTTWTSGNYYLGSQNPQGNTTWGLNRVNLSTTVAPSAQTTFSINITAPSTPGTYNFQWQVGKDGLGNFGAMSQNRSIPVYSNTSDTDGDGIPDMVELTEGTNPLVKDNDIFNNSRLFAMQQYRDYLGREGDAAGIVYWTNQITSGQQTRAQVIDGFFNSPEFQAVTPIARLYFAYFLRIPDYGGLLYWVNQNRNGLSLDSISESFAQSPEFIFRYGSLNNADFVTLVYQNVLGRAPDPAGFAYWTGLLNSGAYTRGQVMLGFSESPEYTASSFNKVYVTQMYVGMLRRSPEQEGFDYWVHQMELGQSGLNLINGFLVAPEYHGRFLP